MTSALDKNMLVHTLGLHTIPKFYSGTPMTTIWTITKIMTNYKLAFDIIMCPKTMPFELSNPILTECNAHGINALLQFC